MALDGFRPRGLWAESAAPAAIVHGGGETPRNDSRTSIAVDFPPLSQWRT